MTGPGRKSVVVLGAGGHAKVVISTLRATGYAVRAVYDDSPAKWGGEMLGVRVQGAIRDCPDNMGTLGVIAVGDNATRARVASQFRHLEWVTAVHPRAAVDPSVSMGPGTVVFAGAVIQPDSRVGHQVIINTGATVDHDCDLSDFVHLAPGAHLAGGVRIGVGAFLGMGCTVLPNVEIGEWSTVGAGSVVLENLPGHLTAVGVPAKVMKKVKQ